MDFIGQVLLARKLIQENQLERVIDIQKRTGSRIGDIVLAEGIMSYLELYKSLADYHGLAFINLLKEPPDDKLLSESDIDEYIKFRLIPYRKTESEITVVTSEYNDETKKWIYNKFGNDTEIAFTSPVDIRKTIERVFGKVIEENSRLDLWRKKPRASAFSILSTKARGFFLYLTASFLGIVIIFPVQAIITFVIICNIIFAVNLLFRIYIFIKGIGKKDKTNWQELLARLNEKNLPVYTLLVPMYKEAESVNKIIKNIELIDYPPEKMDIKLILEEDDYETIYKSISLKPKYNFEIITVPANTLRTKPKACNYAMNFARGDYVTIFDAEDKPDELQLKKSVAYFSSLPEDTICLQARLTYYNYNDNFLTCFFNLEYSILFDVTLYGLKETGIPIPLGGTSNHISMKALKNLGNWDAYNVTEDADLGIRLSGYGLKTSLLDSDTEEEAPIKLSSWIRQRSRWIKGYMQTWLVHMRNPITLYKKLGLTGFIGFQIFIGLSSLIFLTAPLLWVIALSWIIFPEYLHKLSPLLHSGWLVNLSIINLIANFLIHWFMVSYCVSLKEESTAKYKIAALFYPFYLILHSIASYKALYQLIVKPYFWEKTPHGLSKQLKTPANDYKTMNHT